MPRGVSFDLPRKGIIKDRVIIASYCQIWTYGSFYEKNINQDPKYGENFGEVIIEEGVIIYSGSIVSTGVTIEDYSRIGAGSVVLKSIPNNTFFAGNPATYVKNRELKAPK